MGSIILRKIKLEDIDVEIVERGEPIPLQRVRDLEKKST